MDQEAPVTIASAMSQAVALATRGPLTGGNPRVGCVILSPSDSNGNHQILAEGWHRGAGTPHAEVAAIQSAQAQGIDLTGSVFVVTLEPCNHTGRTGPCSEAIIETDASAVYYGATESTQVAGGGAAHLRAAGIAAELQHDDAAAELTRDWAYSRATGLPHTILKTAMSLDGRVAAVDGTSKWITGPQARAHAHQVRATVDAIIVGTGTILSDDPSLTARLDDGSLAAHQPHAIVIGRRKIPSDAQVWQHPGGVTHWTSHDIRALNRELAARGLWRVLVEGGPTVTSAFAAKRAFRELHSYVAPVLLGDGRPAFEHLSIHTLNEAQRGTFSDPLRLGADLFFTYRQDEPRQGDHS